MIRSNNHEFIGESENASDIYEGSPFTEHVRWDDERFQEFAEHVLKVKFGYEKFKPNQLNIIKSILSASISFCFV
jgi:superfamily II DNA helicase RecQ